MVSVMLVMKDLGKCQIKINSVFGNTTPGRQGAYRQEAVRKVLQHNAGQEVDFFPAERYKAKGQWSRAGTVSHGFNRPEVPGMH
jgi:hypothetical protein